MELPLACSDGKHFDIKTSHHPDQRSTGVKKSTSPPTVLTFKKLLPPATTQKENILPRSN